MEDHSNERGCASALRQGMAHCFEDNDTLYVHWVLTYYCNYRCSYCFAHGTERRSRKSSTDISQISKTVEHLASANRKHYRIILMGGEPTTFPLLFETVILLWMKLGKRIDYIKLYTNGSFNDGKVKALIDTARFVNILPIISLHAEFVNMERISEIIKRLAKSVGLHIKVMLHPERSEQIKAIVDELVLLRREYAFSMEVVPVRMPPDFVFDDDRYTPAHYDFIRETQSRFEAAAKSGVRSELSIAGGGLIDTDWFFLEQNECGGIVRRDDIDSCELSERTDSFAFKGMNCIAGANTIDIHSNGLCKGLVCNAEKPRVRIFNVNPFLSPDWIHGVRCPYERCGNKCNHVVPKFRSDEEAEAFIAEKRRLYTANMEK